MPRVKIRPGTRPVPVSPYDRPDYSEFVAAAGAVSYPFGRDRLAVFHANAREYWYDQWSKEHCLFEALVLRGFPKIMGDDSKEDARCTKAEILERILYFDERPEEVSRRERWRAIYPESNHRQPQKKRSNTAYLCTEGADMGESPYFVFVSEPSKKDIFARAGKEPYKLVM